MVPYSRKVQGHRKREARGPFPPFLASYVKLPLSNPQFVKLWNLSCAPSLTFPNPNINILPTCLDMTLDCAEINQGMRTVLCIKIEI